MTYWVKTPYNSWAVRKMVLRLLGSTREVRHRSGRATETYVVEDLQEYIISRSNEALCDKEQGG